MTATTSTGARRLTGRASPPEVTAAIDDATPDDFVVGVRASQAAVTDEERVWPDGEATAAALFDALSNAGADYVHVTGGDATAAEVPDTDRTLADLAVEHVDDDVAVIANGRLGDPERARAALADGSDLITLEPARSRTTTGPIGSERARRSTIWTQASSSSPTPRLATPRSPATTDTVEARIVGRRSRFRGRSRSPPPPASRGV